MRSPYRILLAILLCSVSLFAQNDWPTLAEALYQDNIPTTGVPTAALQERITSFSSLNAPRYFMIGYYVQHGDSLEPPLWVRLYDKRQKSWRSQSIANTADCRGSVMRIEAIGIYFALDIHLNPSAGCVLLLTSQLRLKRVLSGWVIGSFSSGDMIVEHSQVHFAPTHPLQLDIYDPGADTIQQIFPPKNDPFREDFMSDLHDNISEDYCRRENASCNPADVDTSAEGFETSDATHSFAFLANFSSIGFGPKAEDVVGDRKVLYVFRHRGSNWNYREFLANEFPTSAKDALTPSTIKGIFTNP